MQEFLENVCPILGFGVLIVLSAAYLVYDMVSFNAEPDGSATIPRQGTAPAHSALPPKAQRIRMQFRLPSFLKIIRVAIVLILYSIPAGYLLAAYHRTLHTTIHFIDAVTGEPILQPLTPTTIGPDRTVADVHSDQPGVFEVTWHHGDFVTINIPGYQSWGGFLDDCDLSDNTSVKLERTDSYRPMPAPPSAAAPSPTPTTSTKPAG